MLHHHLTAPPPKVYGFAYHPRCYAAIYGWPQD